jgi:hypothetical protein
MSLDNPVPLIQWRTFTDALTEGLWSGARSLLGQAVEEDIARFLTKHGDLKREDGRIGMVRHGHLP